MKLEYLPDTERIKITPANNMETRGIKNWFNRYVDNYMFDPAFKNKLWDGKRTKYNVEDDTIPMGLWKEAYKCCEEFGYTFEFVNKHEFPLNRKLKKDAFYEFAKEFFNGFTIDGAPFEFREYQLRCAYNILKNRYCNIAVATAGGKTLIYSYVLFYLMKRNPKRKFLLIVPSKTLVSQFYDDIHAFNWRGELDINIQEVFGADEKPRITDPDREPNIVIGTFQSLVEYPKSYFQQFYSVTTDEGHKSQAVSYRKILKRTFCRAYYRWGMSGTFPDDSTYEMSEIMAKTGPVVDVVKAKELMDAGYITKVKIKGIMMLHNDWEFAERLEEIAKRDRKSCYDLECERIQECPERLDLIDKIVSQCKSNTLVLFHNTEYGQLLLERLKDSNPEMDFHYIDGKTSNKKRNAIKRLMEVTNGRVQVLVASFGCLSTGVSIKAINNIIFTQSFKKEQVIIQSIGRALRLHPDKKFAYIFDLVDVFNHDDFSRRTKSKFKNVLFTHWEKRLRIYCDEEYPTTTLEIQLKPV